MLKTRTPTKPRTKLPKRTATRSASPRPKRPLRVVVMMSEEEHDRLLALCEDDVRPVASWFRVVVRRAWEDRQSRKPRRNGNGVFQRQEDDGVRRRVEVWTRLSEEERDQLDVLAGEEDVSVAVWYRRRLREDWASRFGSGKRRPPTLVRAAAPPAAKMPRVPAKRTSPGRSPIKRASSRSGLAAAPRTGHTRRAAPRR